MKKMIAGAIVGILIIILGITVWYFYMTTFLEEGNHILFPLSLIQIGVGVYILFRASKASEPVVTDTEIRPIVHEEALNVIERNKELMQEYDKNAVFKDKLKMVRKAADEWKEQEHFG